LTDKYLECDVRDVKLGVAHHIDMFTAGFHLIKMFDDVVTLFGCETIEVAHEDNKGLVSFIVMYILQTLPHLMGSSTLADVYHLWLSDITLYLHVGERIVKDPDL